MDTDVVKEFPNPIYGRNPSTVLWWTAYNTAGIPRAAVHRVARPYLKELLQYWPLKTLHLAELRINQGHRQTFETRAGRGRAAEGVAKPSTKPT